MSQQPHPDRVRLLPWSIPGWLIDAGLISFLTVGFVARSVMDDDTFDEQIAGSQRKLDGSRHTLLR